MQQRQLGAQLTPRTHPQQLREQAVVAVPLAPRVDAENEPVGALELAEDVTTRTLTGERIRKIAADPVHDRRAQQEPAQLRRLAVEHLGEQVVAHDAIVAGELLHELLRVVAALEAERRQAQPRAPTLGAGAQRRHQLGREVQAVRRKQRTRLGLVEREVGRADLDQPPADAQDVQRQRRVRAGAEDEPQRVGRVQHEEAEIAQALA